MCCMLKKNEYIYPAYISKHNLNHESQINLLMIPIGDKNYGPELCR